MICTTLPRTVTVLIGPPCVGKSSYLKKMEYDFVISSDDIVAILCKRAGMHYHDFFKQPANSSMKKQHAQIFKQLVSESKSFSHVVWDLTNLTRKARKSIFKHYLNASFNAVVFDFLGHEKTLLDRNKHRFINSGKWVDDKVMQQMLKNYEPIDKNEYFCKVIQVSINEN